MLHLLTDTEESVGFAGVVLFVPFGKEYDESVFDVEIEDGVAVVMKIDDDLVFA